MASSFRDYEHGAGPMDYTLILDPVHAWQVVSARLHLTGGPGWFGDWTITLDAAAGAVYNTVFLTADMALVHDVLWEPTRPVVLRPTDNIRYQWTNKFQIPWGIETIWQLGAA